MTGPEWTDAEKILFPALKQAERTFSDLRGTMRTFVNGNNLSFPGTSAIFSLIEASCEVAEREARFAYEDADKAERESSPGEPSSGSRA